MIFHTLQHSSWWDRFKARVVSGRGCRMPPGLERIGRCITGRQFWMDSIRSFQGLVLGLGYDFATKFSFLRSRRDLHIIPSRQYVFAVAPSLCQNGLKSLSPRLLIQRVLMSENHVIQNNPGDVFYYKIITNRKAACCRVC